MKQILIFISIIFTGFQNVATAQSNEALSETEISIIKISAFTAIGDLEKLKPALNSGLENGLTVNEIREVLLHLYAYCGFPRSIRGLQTFMQVLDERKVKGISDKIGNDASIIDETSS